ncbi:hypothetical protein BHM03_00047731 [Ensete ventricosum]|nr:hypothetical protein BHM03_00047731 [Ensete ventricosum]
MSSYASTMPAVLVVRDASTGEDMWSHLAKPFTADLRHVGCSNPHFCVSPKVSIKEQDKQEDEEAAIGNLTRGSTAAVENQSSGVVNQQPSSLTSLPK